MLTNEQITEALESVGAAWLMAPDDAHGQPGAIRAVADAAAAHASQWQPIETCPQDGYFLVHEDSAIRALLRIDGVWHKPGYPALIEPTFGDALVGDDARRMLPPGYRLELRDGCCDKPTHWMPLPSAPQAPNVSHEAGTKGDSLLGIASM